MSVEYHIPLKTILDDFQADVRKHQLDVEPLTLSSIAHALNKTPATITNLSLNSSCLLVFAVAMYVSQHYETLIRFYLDHSSYGKLAPAYFVFDLFLSYVDV